MVSGLRLRERRFGKNKVGSKGRWYCGWNLKKKGVMRSNLHELRREKVERSRFLHLDVMASGHHALYFVVFLVEILGDIWGRGIM